LAVIVLKNGRTEFKKGYGLANLETLSRNEPVTDFRLASVTKEFTAMSIMLLVHDGKLHYEDRLTSILPEFPAYGAAITVRELLTHTSGLKDYQDLYQAKFPGVSDEKIPQITDREVLDLLEKQTATDFGPGTKWSYSNSGYAVLAMVVEKVSQKPFGQFLRDRIFAPLDMQHTLAYQKGKNEVPNRAFGYKKDGSKWVKADQSSTSAALGDGGIYSNVEDLAKWDRALREHTLLSADEMKPALVPVGAPGKAGEYGGGPVEYGFGWFLSSYQGRRRMWHDGETTGFRNTIQRFVDEDLTIIVLSNREDLNPESLALKVADRYAPSDSKKGN
jgi:CubicO group peptidase (beta-lactamase class C family)